MTKTEIKNVLAQKFEDEGCGFTAKDIKVLTNTDNHIALQIKDYEHLTIEFKRSYNADDVKYNMGWLATEKYTKYPDETEWCEADNDLETLLKYVGYMIAQTY